MATVQFTQNIQRHVDCPKASVSGACVRDVMEGYFAQYPDARGYVVDDQGALRHHMLIFVDGQALEDRERLSDAVSERSELFVFQALSGG